MDRCVSLELSEGEKGTTADDGTVSCTHFVSPRFRPSVSMAAVLSAPSMLCAWMPPSLLPIPAPSEYHRRRRSWRVHVRSISADDLPAASNFHSHNWLLRFKLVSSEEMKRTSVTRSQSPAAIGRHVVWEGEHFSLELPGEGSNGGEHSAAHGDDDDAGSGNVMPDGSVEVQLCARLSDGVSDEVVGSATVALEARTMHVRMLQLCGTTSAFKGPLLASVSFRLDMIEQLPRDAAADSCVTAALGACHSSISSSNSSSLALRRSLLDATVSGERGLSRIHVAQSAPSLRTLEPSASTEPPQGDPPSDPTAAAASPDVDKEESGSLDRSDSAPDIQLLSPWPTAVEEAAGARAPQRQSQARTGPPKGATLRTAASVPFAFGSSVPRSIGAFLPRKSAAADGVSSGGGGGTLLAKSASSGLLVSRHPENPWLRPPVEPSARQREQLDECARLKAAFIRAGVNCPSRVLERALLLPDDLPIALCRQALPRPTHMRPVSPNTAREMREKEAAARAARGGKKNKKRGGKKSPRKRAKSPRK
jgi:hypothetical protein